MNATVNSMFNIIVTDDLETSKQFYETYFGFAVVVEMEWYIHLANKKGVQIAFMKPELEEQHSVFRAPWKGQGLILSFEVEDAKEEFNKLQKTEIRFAMDVQEEQWGQIHFAVHDPNGIVIDVVQTVDDPSKGGESS